MAKSTTKPAAAISKPWIVLTSSCGNINQAEYHSVHATEALAKVAAVKAASEKDRYGSDIAYEAVFIGKLSGKIKAVITVATEYIAT